MGEVALQVGENIRLLRRQRGLSQEKLALKAGINTSYMGEIERAEKSPTIDIIEKIASALDIEIERLFHFEMKSTKNAEMTYLEKINYELRNRTKKEQETVYQFIIMLHIN